MSRAERAKGLSGEREVALLYELLGFEVRGLEAAGDHLIVCDAGSQLVLHSEVKRHETARPWAWMAQAWRDAPVGTMPVVHFRRNRSRWHVLLEASSFTAILGQRREALEQLAAARAELEARR